ncbi:hypothetical protein EDD64_12210 [Effusibacillus lacus]|nr:hypothetical protein EDD64_12210 [Effusibacillus lacus]
MGIPATGGQADNRYGGSGRQCRFHPDSTKVGYEVGAGKEWLVRLGT